MKNKIILAVMVMTLISCSDFLDINTDPNNPTTASLNTILPYAQATMFGSLGFGTAGISESLAVYAHQTVQRGDQDDYNMTANEFSLASCWNELYSVALPDINQMIKQGAAEGRLAYSGIGKILKAQIFSLMVDMWGDIPYSESGDPVLYKFPHFDDDAVIYADLFTLIESGIADLNAGGAPPGSDDVIYGGDLDKWKAYANSLMLNMYNKVRLTDLYDATKVSELLSSELISSLNGDFELPYNNSLTPENRNPAFIREYAQGNPQYYISPYFYLLMKGEQACQNSLLTGIPDPRLPYYFYNQLTEGEEPQNPTSYTDGNFLSIWFGSVDRDPNEGFDQNISQTVCGLYPLGGAFDDHAGRNADNDSGLRGAAAQRILTAAGVDYIRAELALTKGTGEDGRELLASAIGKSFAKVNAMAVVAGVPLIPNAGVDGYISAVLAIYDAGDDELKLEVIRTEKWIQEFGFAIEAYSDIRRTGYPQVCDPAQDLNEFSIQTNPYPVSLYYSANDITNNQNSPGQRNTFLDKVFWDAN